jgi:hypothetical protein
MGVGEAGPENSYTVELGIFVVHMVRELAEMKIINLTIGSKNPGDIGEKPYA